MKATLKSFIFIVVAMIAMTSCTSTRLGTVQNTKKLNAIKEYSRQARIEADQLLAAYPESKAHWQIKELEKEIKEFKKDLKSRRLDSTQTNQTMWLQAQLYADSVAIDRLKMMDTSPEWVKAKVEYYWQFSNELKSQGYKIVMDYVKEDGLKEASARELARRTRANIVTRQEMVNNKSANFVASAAKNNPGYVEYEGIISSTYLNQIVHVDFIPLNGGETKSVDIPGRSSFNESYVIFRLKLIPGTYLVRAYSQGNEIKMINPQMAVPKPTGAVSITGETTAFAINFTPPY